MNKAESDKKATVDPDRKCPKCSTPYGMRRRCYKCKPPGFTAAGTVRSVVPATPYNGHAKNRLPSIESLDLAGTRVKRGAGGHVSALRAELRATGEILCLVEKLDRDAAVRVLQWVLGRLQ